MLLVANNTLFIRNPQKNKDTPYNPPELTDSDKALVDAQLLGRGLHCEFGFEPINLNTGNFYLSQTDIEIPSDGESFGVTRSYNSRGASVDGMFGRGWRWDYDEHLTRLDENTYYYTRGDGSSLPLAYGGDGCWHGPDGYRYTLTRKVTGAGELEYEDGEEIVRKPYDIYGYELTDAQGTVREFDQYGNLIRITDSQGRSVRLTYDDSYGLTSVISTDGKAFFRHL